MNDNEAPDLSKVTETLIDRNAARNAIADEVIKRFMSSDKPDDMSWDEYYEESEKLAAKAGRALANRHVFAIDTSSGTINVCIIPTAAFEKWGATDQSCLSDAQLQGMITSAECNWEIVDSRVTNPLEAARFMQSRGFNWNKKYQKFIDNSVMKELAPLEKKVDASSDVIKQLIVDQVGGAAADWKRLSKKKNVAGLVERVFENKKSGRQIQVVDLGNGHLLARTLSDKASVAFAKRSDTNVVAIAAVQEKAAEEVVERLLQRGEIDDALIKRAGKALAKHFVFAIGVDEDMDGLFAYVTTGDYDQDIDHVVGHLMPKGCAGEGADMSFEFPDHTDPVSLARDLLACGFTFDAEFQREFDENMNEPQMPKLKSLAKELAEKEKNNTLKGNLKP